MVRKERRRFSNGWLIILFALAACAGQGPPPSLLQGLREHGFRTIAVRARPYEQTVRLDEPVKGIGAGAAVGAAQAGGAWLGAGPGPHPFAAIAWLALTPVAVVTGAIVGAGSSHSEKEVRQATDTIKSTISAARPSTEIAEAVVRGLAKRHGVDSRSRVLIKEELNLSNAKLGEMGFEAALEIEVLHLDLPIFGKIDPDASVAMVVQVTLAGVEDARPAAPLSWTYLGKRADFFDLAKNDATLLRRSLENGYSKISELILADLFPAP